MKIGPIRDDLNKGNFWFYFEVDRRGIALDLYVLGRGFNFEIRLPDLFLVGGTINFVNMGLLTRYSHIQAKKFRVC